MASGKRPFSYHFLPPLAPGSSQCSVRVSPAAGHCPGTLAARMACGGERVPSTSIAGLLPTLCAADCPARSLLREDAPGGETGPLRFAGPSPEPGAASGPQELWLRWKAEELNLMLAVYIWTLRLSEHAMKMLPGVGVFGTGSTARVLVPLLRAEGFSIEALWGKTEEEAKQLAEEMNIEFYTSRTDDVLLHQDVDLVCINIPPPLTRQIAVKALGTVFSLLSQSKRFF
ncbi:queuine tRNA-ribosyltransferase [Platysternon megacephalum]|uniref:Glucose-fructose oxidoreductase domain-containing protein 2 n=1 Tax=Platysternon megacephalum TaxID=55544 RepID=A0A4D9DS90_9SAUR|nr:queuine tRNA-ribosyltransferase [Platysternon megacephalum]